MIEMRLQLLLKCKLHNWFAIEKEALQTKSFVPNNLLTTSCSRLANLELISSRTFRMNAKERWFLLVLNKIRSIKKLRLVIDLIMKNNLILIAWVQMFETKSIGDFVYNESWCPSYLDCSMIVCVSSYK